MNANRDGWVEVRAGEVRIAISENYPVGIVRGPGTEVGVSWPDLDVGSRAMSTTVLAAPTGAWVDVSFTHPYFPGGRLRRSIRVFDDAGRVRPSMYNSIHLMEDLETRALPDPADAHNGVLDI